MRRRPGIEGLQNAAAAARNQFRLVGENMAEVKTDVMKGQLATFRSKLEEFALKHKITIAFTSDGFRRIAFLSFSQLAQLFRDRVFLLAFASFFPKSPKQK